MPRGFEASHATFPLPGGLVRILRSIVQPFVPAMFDRGQHFGLGRRITTQFVGNDDSRHVLHHFEQLAKEFPGRWLVPA